MAKIRVHELAKQLGVPSKDVVAFMASKGVKVTAQNGLEDEQVQQVRNAFASSSEKGQNVTEKNTENKKKKETAETAENKEGAPKKKKNITAVFNTQYAKGRGGRDEKKNQKNRGDGNRSSRDRQGNGHNEVRRGPIKPRPESQRTVRPKGLDAQPQEVFEKKPAAPVQAPVENTAPKAEKSKTAEAAPKRENVFEQQKERRPIKRGNIFDNMKNRPSQNGQGGQNANGGRHNNDHRGPKRDNAFNNDRRGNGGRGNASVAGGAPGNDRKNDGHYNNNQDRRKKNNRDRDALGKKQEHYVNLEKNGGKKRTKNNNNKTEKRNMDEVLTIVLPDHLTIRELADKMKVQPSDIVKKLFMSGKMVTVNSDVDYDEAEEIALEFNCVCEHEEKVDVIAELLKEEEEDPKDLVPRPPVVCVMGHVDHGKTSLLDQIRNTHITDREAGGITQKIGAYVVSIGGRKITFLDTPGHEAFTAMRMRGASSTDIAILVVAADDGVMPQTVEAINHAKAAGIEIIVAINKIDKPNANIERVKQELSEYELIPEDWGGSTIFVPVSAHSGEGIDQLLEMVLLTADVLELKANPKRNARGLCVEAELDKGRGVVATILVQKGTLHVGDPVAAGSSFGKVRAMIDENGKRVKKAGPSTPVEILGLSEVPNAGEIFQSFDSEREARDYASTFVSVGKDKLIEESRRGMSLDDLFSQIQAGNVKELDIIVKADVQGSVEAVKTSLEKLSNEEVVVKVIHGGVGSITESDVNLAAASNAIIIGFNVRPDNVAKATADHEGVDVRLYKVIYNAIEDVESAMKGMLEPIFEEKVIGHATIRQIFKASQVGNIAGSVVDDGYFERDCSVRIRRGDEQIFEGKLASLKRFKDDVKQVKAGYECGLVFEGFTEFAVDDVIEAYAMVEVPRQ
ncbi:translation initiation factor IF-2 [Lachnospiraceae bacterium C10]|nr:translation initiation factor IF-2 [Lachnospiraceae bacterium C10]